MGGIRMAELMVVLILIAVGTPVGVHLGQMHGERLASRLYAGPDQGQAFAGAEQTAGGTRIPPSDAVPQATPAILSEGAALYRRYCVTCHGEGGRGDGPAAAAMVPPPRDFRNPAANWTRGFSPREVFAAVSGGSPGTAMMGFAQALTENQRWALVHYVRSLREAGDAIDVGKGE